MAPIRIGLIGLSAFAKVSWAEQGHLPYLLSPRGRSHYQIVALLNSSKQAAEAARTYFNLPADVAAYGDPEELASDPNVDLVVCNTRVDTHVTTTAPSVKAGKAVYIEWPLAENYEAGLSVADESKVDTNIIGLQGRVSPIALKVKELLSSNRIGRILSSHLTASANMPPRVGLPDGLAYFGERRIGGNPITIAYGHTIDYVNDILGEFASFESRMQLQHPSVQIHPTDGSRPVYTSQVDVPDLLVAHGRLAPGKADIVDGATLSVYYRTAQQFKGTPGLEWTINGEKGELRITASGAYLQANSYWERPRIQLHDHHTDKVCDVEWDWEDWQKELPVRSRLVAELYERYAHWWEGGRGSGDLPDSQTWPRLHDALALSKHMELLFQQYDSSNGSQAGH